MAADESRRGQPDPASASARAQQPKTAGWPESSYILSLINDNKVISLVLYGAFVLLKVLAVSHWNIATASAILASSSASDLILGALLSALPMALLIVLSFVLFSWLSGHWVRRYSPRRVLGEPDQPRLRRWARARWSLLLTLGALIVLVVLLPPAAPALVCIGSAIILGIAARFADPVRGTEPKSARAESELHLMSGRATLVHNWGVLRKHLPTFYCAVALSVVVIVVGYAQLVSSVWIPHERITCRDCAHPVIGYVLNANSSELTVLVSGSRIVEIVPAEGVLKREVCTIPYSWPLTTLTSSQKTIAQTFGLQDKVPSCQE